jgi:metallo-beta-lactamase family protein
MEIPVQARIERIDGLSAHADQRETLRWLAGFFRPPAMTWLVHGEPEQAAAPREVMRVRLGWTAEVARDGATCALVVGGSHHWARRAVLGPS